MTTSVPVPAVGAVIIQNGAILLVQRAVEPGVGLWAVPGGRVDRGESWQEAVRREVLEETGLDVDVGGVAWVGEVIGDDHHFAIVDFFGTVIGGELRAGSDAADVRWVPLLDAPKLPMPESMHSLLADLRS